MTIDVKERFIRGSIAAALLAVFALLFLIPSADIPLPACAFHSLTGYSCPTCGLTRSLHALLSGDVIASLRFHAMGPIVVLLAGFYFFILGGEAWRGTRVGIPWIGRSGRRILSTAAFVWLVYGGMRFLMELLA